MTIKFNCQAREDDYLKLEANPSTQRLWMGIRNQSILLPVTLSKSQIQQLIKHLQLWVDTGELEEKPKKKYIAMALVESQFGPISKTWDKTEIFAIESVLIKAESLETAKETAKICDGIKYEELYELSPEDAIKLGE